MSEEEKKAVIFLKHYLEDDDVFKISNKDLRIILNLIEKQQKELEQEKEKNKELERKLKLKNGDIDYISAKINNHFIDDVTLKDNYISKDKIKEEIEHLSKNILDIENITMLKGKTLKEQAEIELYKYATCVLTRLLEEK